MYETKRLIMNKGNLQDADKMFDNFLGQANEKCLHYTERLGVCTAVAEKFFLNYKKKFKFFIDKI